jgi:CBS domain-containing protein
MIAKEILNTTIMPLTLSDTGLTALNRMDEFKLDTLPVVNNSEYLTLLKEEEILEFNLPDISLSEFHFPSRIPAVNQNQHLLELLKILTGYNCGLVAVVDERNRYRGCITQNEIFKALASLDIVQNPGGIIVLEVNVRDYSLSEIAQIVEANDAKVMGLFTSTPPDSTRMSITLKTNIIDISPILATLSRYDYSVTASFGQSDLDDLLRDRYDSLMNFLNI